MWTERKLRAVKSEVVSKTLRIYDEVWPGYKGKPPYEHHFAALKRLLDRKEPDYADQKSMPNREAFNERRQSCA